MSNIDLIKATLESSPLWKTMPEEEQNVLLARIFFLESFEQQPIMFVH